MIIFDLDGTLADCEHRRHFVDPLYREDSFRIGKTFYEACDKDVPINHVIDIFSEYNDDEYNCNEIQIWSGRCESVRDKTEKWLKKYTSFDRMNCRILKMRPIGDNTPDEKLKEKWLDEVIAEGKIIDFVFDNRTKVVDMYRRRGIFVFDVNQSGNEF